MRFEIKELREAAEVNSGESESSKELVKLLFLATISILVIYFLVSYASEYFIRNITVEQEKEWFSDFDLSPIDINIDDSDSEQVKKVEVILSQLSKHPSVPKLNYKIFVIQDDDINAFAFPGGSIGVTSGLLTALEESNDSEKENIGKHSINKHSIDKHSIDKNSIDKNKIALAFVIGHELGHFKFRHHLKGLSRTISVGLAFALLTGNSGDLSLISNVLTLLELNHSQKQETESDLFSAELVFDTYGSTKNIEKLFLVLKEKHSENESLSFLNTHPSSKARIHNLLSYSQSLTAGQ